MRLKQFETVIDAPRTVQSVWRVEQVIDQVSKNAGSNNFLETALSINHDLSVLIQLEDGEIIPIQLCYGSAGKFSTSRTRINRQPVQHSLLFPSRYSR